MNPEFQIKRLGTQDIIFFKKLIMLFQEVFEMEEIITVKESYLKNLLEKPDFIVYAAIAENEIVGGLTAYELNTYYTEGSELFIYDIAVSFPFQRKGVGKQLIQSLKNYGEQNNIEVMFVEANKENQHAVDFYHSTGGNAEKVIHFNYYLGKIV
jgi:aminoglycoside 3-N-acetyltransferase I